MYFNNTFIHLKTRTPKLSFLKISSTKKFTLLVFPIILERPGPEQRNKIFHRSQQEIINPSTVSGNKE